MKKKSLKKTMVIALAGIMLAGSLGWSQLSARAAVNGDVICAHEHVGTYTSTYYEMRGFRGHMAYTYEITYCRNPDCNSIVRYVSQADVFETHDFDEWEMVEDRGDGLYEFWVRCSKCGYEDEFPSGNPDHP